MLLVFFLDSFRQVSCKWNVFVDGQPLVVPLDIARVTESTGQSVDLCHCGIEWEICEINPGRKNLVVTSLEVCEGTRSWICGCEIMKGAEETVCGYCRKLFKSLYDHHLAFGDIYTPDEYVKTI